MSWPFVFPRSLTISLHSESWCSVYILFYFIAYEDILFWACIVQNQGTAVGYRVTRVSHHLRTEYV